jgi:hypothetical protein
VSNELVLAVSCLISLVLFILFCTVLPRLV